MQIPSAPVVEVDAPYTLFIFYERKSQCAGLTIVVESQE